jgi:undecaprenyl-diphosphatase
LKRKIGFLQISVIEFIAATGVFLLAVITFSWIADEMVIEKGNQFDVNVFNYLASYHSPFITKLAETVTEFGTGYFLIPAYLLIIWYCINIKNKPEAIMVGIVAAVSLLSGWLLKDIFHRPRPILPLVSGAGGYSFPSGHSLGGFTFSGVSIYLLWKSTLKLHLKWILSLVLLLLAILIGLSRIYLRVHFASDVLGSLLVTIVWLSLTFILLETIEKTNELE